MSGPDQSTPLDPSSASSRDGAIRPARPGDEPHIARFIRDLARYEKLEHELDLSEARLTEHLFGDSPVCSSLLIEHEGKPVGFALFFTSYSTFWCKPCLFLEDLYVDPEFRGHGYGLRLLKALAAEAARQRGYLRIQKSREGGAAHCSTGPEGGVVGPGCWCSVVFS